MIADAQPRHVSCTSVLEFDRWASMIDSLICVSGELRGLAHYGMVMKVLQGACSFCDDGRLMRSRRCTPRTSVGQCLKWL